MLRLHRVVVCKDILGFPPPGNVTSIFPFPIKRIKGKICYILDPYSERLLDLL